MEHTPRWRARSWVGWAAGIPDLEHGRLAYVADFATYGIIVGAMSAWLLLKNPPAAWPLLVALALAGLAAWTLIEYLMHRWLLHRVEPFRGWHALHHQRPLALIGTPTWISLTLITVLVYAPAWAVLGSRNAVAVTLGVTSGYLAYGLLHHAVHHWRARWAWLRSLKRLHARHHHVDGARCFGVTNRIWDVLFDTGIEQRQVREVRPPPKG